ncbi:MAG: DUF4863 family protein [Myxococcales bacterium]|nr:DUF4863 family protein [Myxococcales bacterium]
MPDSSMSVDGRAELITLLQPMLARVAELRPQERASAEEARALADALTREFPPDGAAVQAVGAAIAAGVSAGWLCHKGEPNARFSRVARASAETHELSIDAVRLRGPALRHTHPRGEVTLAFPVEGEAPTFEGAARGWIALAAGTTHIPEVVGGCMNLIYFLPDGAVEWLPA